MSNVILRKLNSEISMLSALCGAEDINVSV